MNDREKIITEIEDALSGNLAKVGYVYRMSLNGLKDKALKDVLAMLKEHEHGETFSVIDTKTGKEADEYEIALHEDWAKHLCYCDMEGWAIENDGTLLLVDECGRFAYADRERFKVVWDA